MAFFEFVEALVDTWNLRCFLFRFDLWLHFNFLFLCLEFALSSEEIGRVQVFQIDLIRVDAEFLSLLFAIVQGHLLGLLG